MTTLWEIADEDISLVIACHKSKTTVEVARASLSEPRVVEALTFFSDFADQVAAASSSIEDQLMEAGSIPTAKKRFEVPSVAR